MEITFKLNTEEVKLITDVMLQSQKNKRNAIMVLAKETTERLTATIATLVQDTARQN
jgi:hypothetical protein